MTRKKDNASAVDWKAIMEGQKDFLKPLVQEVLQQVLEAEMDEALGADRHERTAGRLGYRSGHYRRTPPPGGRGNGKNHTLYPRNAGSTNLLNLTDTTNILIYLFIFIIERSIGRCCLLPGKSRLSGHKGRGRGRNWQVDKICLRYDRDPRANDAIDLA